MGVVNSTLQELNIAFQDLNPLILNIIIALIMLLIGFILGKLVGTMIKRLLSHLELDKLLVSYLRINFKAETFIAGIISFIIYFFTVIAAINQVGLLSILLQIISYVVVIAILVSIVLGLRNIIPNVYAGFTLKKKLNLKTGQKISVGNVSGKITKINTVYVYVKTQEQDLVLVPFSAMLQENVTFKKKS